MNTVKAGMDIRLNMRGFIPVIVGITSYISPGFNTLNMRGFISVVVGVASSVGPAFRVYHLSVVGPIDDGIKQVVVEPFISHFGMSR